MTRSTRAPLLAAALVAAALMAPGGASAATVSTVSGIATFTAATGETNQVTVLNYFGQVQFNDTGVSAMTAGTGCTSVTAQKVNCSGAGVSAIAVDLGDGDDSFSAFFLNTPMTISGGAGNDTIAGDIGNDTIDGGDGNDTIDGRGGDDTIDGGDGGDTIVGGTGSDTVTYASRTAPVTVTLGDGLANDGATGEADNVDGTVETLVGGAAGDTLTGGSANETILGGPGDDALAGSGGDDTLDGGAGTDSFDGGAGIDTIKARDTLAETIACGSEADAVEADYSDTVAADCEAVDKSAAPPVVPPPVLPVLPPPPPPTGIGPVIDPPIAGISAAPAAVSSKGVVTVKLACPPAALEGCAGTVSIALVSKKKGAPAHAKLVAARRRKTPGHRRFKMAAGQTASVPVQLPRRAFRKVKKSRHSMKAAVTVVMTTSSGTTTSTRVVNLRRVFKVPKRKKK